MRINKEANEIKKLEKLLRGSKADVPAYRLITNTWFRDHAVSITNTGNKVLKLNATRKNLQVKYQ